jgi:hypothetical protein
MPDSGWYRGDCHVHSLHSHGADQTPQRLAADARALGLDFVATTEHNNADGHRPWAALGGGDLLVLLGQEVVTRTGHWLALGLPEGRVVGGDYGVRDAALGGHLDEVRRGGGLCVAAHPHAPYPSGTLMYPLHDFDVVEIWNGPWTSDAPWQADNEAALAEWGRGLAAEAHRGSWRPAMGNSDAHLAGQLGIPHTVVAAEAFHAQAILAGLRAGRSWIAESASVRLGFTVAAGGRRAGIGERIETDGGTAHVRARVDGVPGGVVSFHTERGGAHRAALPPGGAATAAWSTSAAESGFVRVEVRHPDGRMAALSNPIVLD